MADDRQNSPTARSSSGTPEAPPAQADGGSQVPETYRAGFVWGVSLSAAMGGLLFGYDWIVISGTKPFFEKFFHLTSAAETGWAMASALVGCMIGALLCGSLSDRFGRRRLLILAALGFVVTSLGTAAADTISVFNLWRIAGGMAIGLASNVSPMYIAEIAPAAVRGRLVSMNQFAIVIGILLAQAANVAIDRFGPGLAGAADAAGWSVGHGWRWMFAVTAVPAGLFFLASLVLPESPRWLAARGHTERARGVLARVAGEAYAQRELSSIQQTLSGGHQKADFRRLLEPRMLKLLLIGVALAVLQQWCAANVIFYYAADVFRAAGYTVSGALLNIVYIGLVNLVFTVAAVLSVDRFGRRPLLLLGFSGLMLVHLLIGFSYYRGQGGLYVVVLTLAAVACYALTLAPVIWVVLSEIFPNAIRGAAMSISVFALWMACFVLTYTFPRLNQGLGMAGAFWIYAAICGLGLVFAAATVKETKGKSLEEIEKDLGSS
jgi:sugar porter (SP) family MFS transporter